MYCSDRYSAYGLSCPTETFHLCLMDLRALQIFVDVPQGDSSHILLVVPEDQSGWDAPRTGTGGF